jgi:hypothetical protein
VREAARLQGFPDRFRFAGDCCSKQYEQVGNAVPVPLAKALAAAVKRHIATGRKAPRARMTAAAVRTAIFGSRSTPQVVRSLALAVSGRKRSRPSDPAQNPAQTG